jgi:hypothetical protein
MMKPLYATDWHQCRRCLCVRPTAELLHFGVTDPVLNLVHDEYECKGKDLCERLKQGRLEQLQREQGLDPSKPIRPRRTS